MRSKNIFVFTIAIAVLTVAIGVVLRTSPSAKAAPPPPANTTDFESFTTGVSVHYQGTGGLINYACFPVSGGCTTYTVPNPYGSLWTVADEWGLGRITTPSTTDDLDERVVDDGTGNKVWRMSNAVAYNGFSDQPNSLNSPLAAGESSAFLWNDRGTNHTTPVISTRAPAATPYFHGAFRFKSATGAAQPGLTLNVSPTARQSDRRNSFVGLVDTGTGLNVTFAETVSGGGFAPTVTIATGLSYTAWHTIDIYVKFVDGLNVDGSGNDIVTVLVNGGDDSCRVGTTWETFYRVATPTRPVGAVDALMFRSSGTAVPATLGNGFFFDDVVVDNSQQADEDGDGIGDACDPTPFLPRFLVIDEDSIDNGNAPNFFSASAVNDDISRLALRTPLPAFDGSNIGQTYTLYTGQVGDEGWFALKTIPTSWNRAGPTTDGLRNYLGNPAAPYPHGVGNGLGTGSDPEKRLDKIPNVTPLRAKGLAGLVGLPVCAVVYDSDISINYGPLNGSLKGENLGTVAFKVISTSPLYGQSSGSLPSVVVQVLDARVVCNQAQRLYLTAPVLRSSSQPYDTGR